MDTKSLKQIAQLLDQKLEEKLEEKLTPIEKRLNTLEKTVKTHSTYFTEVMDYLAKALGGVETLKADIENFGRRMDDTEVRHEENMSAIGKTLSDHSHNLNIILGFLPKIRTDVTELDKRTTRLEAKK